MSEWDDARARASEIYQVTTPLPFRLNHVHAYVLPTDEGLILIDSGFPSKEGREGLARGLQERFGGVERVRAVIVTHYHSDHIGQAGWIQQQSGAAVYVHARDWRPPPDVGRDDAADEPEEFGGDLAAHLTPELRASSRELRARYQGKILPVERPTLVQGGERLEIGGRRLELVWTPGHTQGHLCVRELDQDILFTGDHMLERITPHVGTWSAGEGNALHRYEESLELVARLNPKLALGAHQAVIEQPAERVQEIRAHHQKRRETALSAIQDEWKPALEVMAAMFGELEDAMQTLLAVSETHVHLEALVLEERARREDGGEPPRYHAMQ